jgi:Transcriptional regulators
MAGVSMVTVRRALAELAGQAIVRREQGRGTFLARRRVSAETTKVGSLRNGLSLDARSSLETRLLGWSGAAPRRRTPSAWRWGAAIVWEVSRLRLLDAADDPESRSSP